MGKSEHVFVILAAAAFSAFWLTLDSLFLTYCGDQDLFGALFHGFQYVERVLEPTCSTPIVALRQLDTSILFQQNILVVAHMRAVQQTCQVRIYVGRFWYRLCLWQQSCKHCHSVSGDKECFDGTSLSLIPT